MYTCMQAFSSTHANPHEKRKCVVETRKTPTRLHPSHSPIEFPSVQESARHIRQHRLRERLITASLISHKIDLRLPICRYRRVVETSNSGLHTSSGERDFREI